MQMRLMYIRTLVLKTWFIFFVRYVATNCSNGMLFGVYDRESILVMNGDIVLSD